MSTLAQASTQKFTDRHNQFLTVTGEVEGSSRREVARRAVQYLAGVCATATESR